MSNADFDKQLASVFSILPQDEAREARDYVAKRLKYAEATIEDDLAWVDFDQSGKILRGGLSSITDHSTRLLPAETDNAQIAAITRHAVTHNVEVGHISWDTDSQLLFWYVPITPSDRNSVAQRRLRGFAVTQLLFSEFVEIFNEESGLTTAELRTVFQVIGGTSLRKAAELDDLSYETKRAHLKNACSKLFCAGQRELITKLLGQMVHFISISEGEASHAGFIEIFASKYLSQDVRLLSRRLTDGRLVNLLEYGPQHGTPVLFGHGLLFPILMQDCAEHLNRLGVRIIIPVREGFLETRPASNLFDQEDLLRQWVDDALGVIREYIGGPCAVMGNSTGARFVVRLAHEAPRDVTHLTLLSATLMQSEALRTRTLSTFFDGLRGLVTNSKLFKAVTWRFKKYYLNEKTCRSVLQKLFGDNPTDLAALDRPFPGGSAYAMFSDIYSSSVRGVAADFSFDFNELRTEMATLTVPLTILHGKDDPLLSGDQLKAEIADPLADKVVVVEGGHFAGATNAAAVWEIVADRVSA